ncbi:MAG: hypothetical protein HQ506_01375 [Candidatus Marinimicrobia bacterium]|nr:hypothetical protein [Candidatus Neomarinimicrobiota bacterium]
MNNWTKVFLNILGENGLSVEVLSTHSGWVETAKVESRNYFTKSVTKQVGREHYFIGIDPRKLSSQGDGVIICCGDEGRLSRVFIFEWDDFFSYIKQGIPINTYKWPKTYMQYKLAISKIDGVWYLNVQGANTKRMINDENQFTVDRAIGHLK